MRPVLIVCGSLAGVFVFVAAIAAWRDRGPPMEPAIVPTQRNPPIEAPSPPTSPREQTPPTQDEPAPSDSTESVGDVVGPHGYSSSPIPTNVAVFPAKDHSARAVRILRCPGECDIDVPAGHYDVCTGGVAHPICRTPRPYGELGRWCTQGDKDCTCTPAPDMRSDWPGACKRVDVSSNRLVRVVGSAGAFGHMTFNCVPPAEVCQ
jgi:hypothetical protein